MKTEPTYQELLQKIDLLEAENHLLKSEMTILFEGYERLNSLFENLQIGVLIENQDRIITQANNHFCKLFGIPNPQILIGLNCGDAIISSAQYFVNPEEFILTVNDVLKNQKIVLNQLLELIDGRFFERDYIPVYHKNEFLGNLWLYKDVSRFKQNEKQLMENNEKLELFFNQSLIGFFFMMLPEPIEWNNEIDKEKTLDYVFSNQRITKINQAMLEQYRATEKSFIGFTPNDLYKHDIEEGRKVWRELLDKGRFKIETNEKKLDGTDMIIEGDYICLYNDDNKIIGHFGVQQEVTQRKLNEQIFKELYKNAPIPYQSLNIDGKILKVNEKWCKITGYTHEEVEGKSFYNLLTPESKKIFEQRFLLLLNAKKIEKNKLEIITKDRQVIQALFEGCTTTDTKGNFLFTNCVFQDITEKLKSEKALKESEEKFRTLIENMSDMVFLIDSNLKIITVNKAAAKLINELPDELFGKKIAEIFPIRISDMYEHKLSQVIKTGKPITIDSDLIKDNVNIYINTRLTPLFDQDGLVKAVIGVSTDITDRRKNELLLIAQEKKLRELNATKDKFFSIIAHDLRSPFGAILGFAEIISEKAQKNEFENINYYSNIINQSAKHTFNLLNNLLQWAKNQQGKIEFKPIDIKIYDLIEEVGDFLMVNRTEKNISFEMEVGKEQILVADYFMLQTIIRNIFSNAIKYTPDYGKISIRTLETPKDLIIEISDTGIGIAPQDIKKLFKIDSNFSTVGTNEETGTGLGLILCHEFVQKHKGKILVKSELNMGSTFSIVLPNKIDHSKPDNDLVA